jgi:predicted short-subunit dehydrogenase-like oxidoreductase (DUF2520 family)
MGQVPMQTILIIGHGKTARHLSYYFKQLSYNILNWHYKRNDFNQLHSMFESSDYCFLLIKDDAIQSFVQRNIFLKAEKTFHCSGSLAIDGVRCIHPLMTFSENLYELNFYKKIHWAIFEPEKKLSDYLPNLNNPYFFVEPDKKIFYHTMCVMSGNFTQLLLQQVIFQWQNNLHLNQSSLQPYLQMILENFWEGGATALTGPLARKDFGTIKKHLNILQDSPLLNIYQTFLKLHLTEQEIQTCLIGE